MLGFGRQRKKKEDKEQTALFRKADGRLIRYASRIVSDGEEILGKDGRIVVTDTEVALRFGERDVFLAPRAEVRCWELMSLDGIRFEHIRPDGSKDAVTAYCKYYRK